MDSIIKNDTIKSGKTSTGKTRSGRSRQRGHARPVLGNQLAWSNPTYYDPPTEPLSMEQIHTIHEASLNIIEEIGIRFLNATSLDILEKEGCRVTRDDMNVRMDRDWVQAMIAHAPPQFQIVPRNPDHRLIIGGDYFNFGQVSSPPNIIDKEGGRRSGTRADFQKFLKLTQSYNCLHNLGGYPVEPLDLHPSIRHLYCAQDMLLLSDKALHAYSLGKERIEDVMEMVRIAAGITHAEFAETPRLFTNINSTSPLKHDYPMLDGAMRMAKKGQPVVITPFTLAGAMAPVTIVGAVTQQNAEALAAIALLQAINPGTPIVYGAFTSNVDMKSGAPAFGTPEYIRAMQISGQLARFYQFPLRASNTNASNAPDGQAVWESAFSLQGALSGHANLIYHAAGWLEGGLSASPEKLVMDCEMLQQMIYLQKPLLVNEDTLALSAIREVGHEGHFFGCAHTQERYKTAFYSPITSDWSNYENWQEAGSVWTHDRAAMQAQRIIDEYEAPPIDAAIRDELHEFVERRAREGGAPTDF